MKIFNSNRLTSLLKKGVLFQNNFFSTSIHRYSGISQQETWNEAKCKAYMTPTALSRQPSPIRAHLPYMNQPGMLSLAGGLPDPELFPLSDIQFTWKDGTQLKLGEKEVQKWLQYGPTKGNTVLLSKVQEYQKKWHGTSLPMCFSNGSQDMLSKVMSMLVAPGEQVLMESPSYPGALALLKPQGIKCVPVPMDSEGLIPSALKQALETASVPPKVLYTVPTAHNPTGITTSVSRRQQILRCAEDHDVLIVEDDPYYFLQPSSSSLPPSYLSLAPYGRVLRLDSISKIVSAGARLGWVTCVAPFLTRLEYDMQASCLQPNSFGQLLFLHHLPQFNEHCRTLVKGYQEKLLHVLRFLHTQCTDYVSFHAPSCGMFLWLKINGIDANLFAKRALAHGLVVVPGYAFYPTPPTICESIRISFSVLNSSDLTSALNCLKQCILETREELGLPIRKE